MTDDMSIEVNSPAFSLKQAENILAQACELAELPAASARPMRLGENALFHLTNVGVVVRIARGPDYWPDAYKEVEVSDWLSGQGIPAAKAVDIPQPISVLGHPVTFWFYIDGRNGGPGDIAALGRVLRRLHALPAPADFRLPATSILDRVLPRIEGAPISDEDRDFLTARVDSLAASIKKLDFPMQPTAIHGDAHVQNLMIRDGEAVLIDFERFAWGQPEWDLAVTATEYVTAGWWTDNQYRLFADSYGYDITEWEGFDVLRQTNEIKMTTWLMQNVNESPDIAREYERRMNTLRTDEATRDWQAF
ncbi:aminoglycoside phosphotransferase family protein [Saccharothrix sp. NRRL B-16348]|uniref:aminoglycoside phosphotransferase family protein n=1 Tax=Saccharothrix sp. NRRL B-16348 TaxID=1415542 RepID=UPI0012F8B78B|nr:aminoglycoside phosphotransferase family protein [Saccharothrix sp. NRRL B-16348]